MKKQNFHLYGAAIILTIALVAIITKSVTAVSVNGPLISGLIPVSGPVTGGTTVTITGEYFDGLQTVLFDNLPATIVTSGSNTINVTTPAHDAGPVDVTVMTIEGRTTVYSAYTYIASPTEDPCKKEKKTAICHLPEGNEENPQQLCLPPGGVAAHLKHNPDDYLGACIGLDGAKNIHQKK